MKKHLYNIIILLTVLLFVSNLDAHVELDYPKGGEAFFVGDTINIEWHILVNHNQNNWDLFFSSDGGGTWQPIQFDLPVSQTTYQWIVPSIITNNAQIRIIMDNVGANYEDLSLNFTIKESALGITEETELPTILNIISNFPNPFNPSTTIQYELSIASKVKVVIYNMLGKEIIQLYQGKKEPGVHMLGWDGFDSFGNLVSAGIYLYQIQAGQYIQTKKMVLLK
jgi:hypothetical protein